MENEDKLATRRDSDLPATAKIRKKELYTKPAFKYERVFEVQALACSKLTGNSMCQPTKKVS